MFYYLNNSNLNAQSARIAISGPDAYTYLQGQFTQDLNRPVGTVSYGLWLNQKGRPLAESSVLRCGETDFLILSRHSLGAEISRRLQDYLVADEVEVLDQSSGWTWLSLVGEGTGALLTRLLGGIPASGGYVSGEGALGFRGHDSSEENYECWLPVAEAGVWRLRLAEAGVREAGAAELARERILHGRPVVPHDIGPADLPNEGGLDATAISYTKGCFLGQEVMARLKNLGQVRRRLAVVRGAGEPPAPGTALFQGEKRMGELRSTAPDGAGWVGFALLTQLGLQRATGLAPAASAPADIAILKDV